MAGWAIPENRGDSFRKDNHQQPRLPMAFTPTGIRTPVAALIAQVGDQCDLVAGLNSQNSLRRYLGDAKLDLRYLKFSKIEGIR